MRRSHAVARYVKEMGKGIADEIFLLDTVASLYGRNSIGNIIRMAADNCFTPIAVGGGLRTIRDIQNCFGEQGGDKVAVCTASFWDGDNGRDSEDIIGLVAEKYGNQAISLQLDAKRIASGRWRAYSNGAREDTGRDAVEWAREAVERGVGEVIATSIDQQGTYAGFDYDLIHALSDLRVPCVASGGLGIPGHAVRAYRAGADAIAVSNAIHAGRCTINEIKQALQEDGVSVRL